MNRYKFAKEVHPEYVVLLLIKGKYITYGSDLELIHYIKFNENLCIFDKYKINYLVLDNLDIIEKSSYDINNYNLYIRKMIIEKIVKKIGNNLVKNIQFIIGNAEVDFPELRQCEQRVQRQFDGVCQQQQREQCQGGSGRPAL